MQGLLELALRPLTGGSVTVHGAGRTDAGVHELAQVASVEVSCPHDTATLMRALNAALPGDVRVVRVEEAAPGFHARLAAWAKHYRFLLRSGGPASPFERAYVWHLSGTLDTDAMREAAGALVGTHDFAAFQSTGNEVSGTVRTITRSTLVEAPERPHPVAGEGLVAYEVSGNGFLRHMVRAIVGTLVEVGQGRRSPAAMAAVLSGRRRAAAGPTAPPHGLFLVGVDYD